MQAVHASASGPKLGQEQFEPPATTTSGADIQMVPGCHSKISAGQEERMLPFLKESGLSRQAPFVSLATPS